MNATTQLNKRPEEQARFLELEDIGHGLAVRKECPCAYIPKRATSGI